MPVFFTVLFGGLSPFLSLVGPQNESQDQNPVPSFVSTLERGNILFNVIIFLHINPIYIAAEK